MIVISPFPPPPSLPLPLPGGPITRSRAGCASTMSTSNCKCVTFASPAPGYPSLPILSLSLSLSASPSSSPRAPRAGRGAGGGTLRARRARGGAASRPRRGPLRGAAAPRSPLRGALRGWMGRAADGPPATGLLDCVPEVSFLCSSERGAGPAVLCGGQRGAAGRPRRRFARARPRGGALSRGLPAQALRDASVPGTLSGEERASGKVRARVPDPCQGSNGPMVHGSAVSAGVSARRRQARSHSY